MWKYSLLLLCATGLSSGSTGPQSVSVNLPEDNAVKNVKIRRFACPVGFFRLKRNCYYLSAGIAPWREAYFHCRDRNATLAVLDKNGKDRILRKYLMGDQFTKLERWIGGIYNWQQMAWEWGVPGEKIVFQNFANLSHGNPHQYAWHCIVLDPFAKYKWNPRSCFKKKHYICEAPAGRIERRRKKTIDPNLQPQNQKMKPRKKGKKYRKEMANLQSHRRNKAQRTWRRNSNQEWAHGVNLGSRPLATSTNRTRHRSNKNHLHDRSPKITQVAPQGYGYNTFLGDGPVPAKHQPLTDDKILSQYQTKINDIALEEVLLKN
ncbi:uncharacterized protein [Chelonus insularis]|uniref:uncharacterized protein n=1 Tax=Chelonus insularis TaxID=460826 RepID=UPI001589A315|nr:uncharacterized protein LOC118070879 [Chelonus insularis]